MGRTTEAQRAARRRQVAKLIRLGKSYAEIADAVDVSKSTVHNDVKRLKGQWRNEAQGDMRDHMARRLAELRAIKREAFAAWLESREEPSKEKVRTEGEGQSVTSVDEDGELDTEVAVTDVEEITKEVTRVAGGDAKHLKNMLDAEKEIQKLLGLHEYEADTEGDRLDDLVDTIEETAKQVDMSQFEDEEIR